jgi:hypothetical protein
MTAAAVIRTPDQRLRVFVSSTLGELAAERAAVRAAIERLRLVPVLFELGARPHPPRELYRAYLQQSQVFVGIYWQRYGWVAPGEERSGLEDEFRLGRGLPGRYYLKEPAPEPRLAALLAAVRDDDRASYRRFTTAEELEELVSQDLVGAAQAAAGDGTAAREALGRPLVAGQLIDDPTISAQALTPLAAVALEAGEVESAHGHLREAVPLVVRSRDLVGVAPTLETLAGLALAAGEADGALEALAGRRSHEGADREPAAEDAPRTAGGHGGSAPG